MASETVRDAHVQAVGFAGIRVEELEQALAEIREQFADVQEIAVNAVGEQPSTDSGRAALQTLGLIKVGISEAMDHCEQAKQHFNDYGRGI